MWSQFSSNILFIRCDQRYIKLTYPDPPTKSFRFMLKVSVYLDLACIKTLGSTLISGTSWSSLQTKVLLSLKRFMLKMASIGHGSSKNMRFSTLCVWNFYQCKWKMFIFEVHFHTRKQHWAIIKLSQMCLEICHF